MFTMGTQDIPLASLDSSRPRQGAQEPWHSAQNPCAFDFSPWEKLPPLREELQATKNKQSISSYNNLTYTLLIFCGL